MSGIGAGGRCRTDPITSTRSADSAAAQVVPIVSAEAGQAGQVSPMAIPSDIPVRRTTRTSRSAHAALIAPSLPRVLDEASSGHRGCMRSRPTPTV